MIPFRDSFILYNSYKKEIGIIQNNIVQEADEKINFEILKKEKQNKQWINMSMVNLLIVERKIKIISEKKFGNKNKFLGNSYFVIGSIILILNIVFLISYKIHQN